MNTVFLIIRVAIIANETNVRIFMDNFYCMLCVYTNLWLCWQPLLKLINNFKILVCIEKK